MKKIVVCYLLLSISSSFLNAQVINIKDLAPRIDSLVKAYQDLDIFSGVVLVAEKGNTLYEKAFGLADRAKKIPNRVNTRFDIGSMNKSFTKVLVLKKIATGDLQMEDSLGRFLADFPTPAQSITIEQLLTHQSGYGDYHTPEYWALPREERTLQRAVEYIKQLPLDFAPGTEQGYSNAGYVLLGAILQSVDGRSYFDQVKEDILMRLGMKDTFLEEKYTVPNRAIGYYKDMYGRLIDNDHLAENPTPAGGFYSSVHDILRFYRAFHYGSELWEEKTRRLDPTYPFYQEHQTSGGAMAHAGGFEGANTVHYEILRDKISVIVFANMDEVVAENLGVGILSLIRGKQPASPALPAVQAVYQAYRQGGINAIRDNWMELTRNFHPDDPKDLILNNIGYTLLANGEGEAATEIFRLNTKLFPDVANCWDSYGQALLETGKREAAINAYRKALEIDPNYPPSREALDKLEE